MRSGARVVPYAHLRRRPWPRLAVIGRGRRTSPTRAPHRRPPGLLTVSVGLLLVVAGCVSACAHAAARLGPTVIVDVAHPAGRLPGDYLGLSFEASILDSTLLDPARSNLPGLL